MLFPPVEPNERFRQRRAAARRRKRRQRAALIGVLLGAVAAFGLGAQLVGGGSPDAASGDATALAEPEGEGPRPLPVEIRGVHVTMALASLPGKLQEYVDLESEGLTAIELDVKDENGEVGFRSSSKLARQVGAARDFYDAREVAKRRSRARSLPHRPHRRLRGSGPGARAGRPRGPAERRLGVGGRGGTRVDEPL